MTSKLMVLTLSVAAFLALTAGTAGAQVSKCSSKEMGAAGKKAGGKAKCWSKATKKGLAVDGTCLTTAETKFSGAYAKATNKGDCNNATTAGTIETKVDDFITDLVTEINGSTGTPTASKCSSKELAAAGKKTGRVVKCYAKAASKGDNNLIAPCISAVETKFSASWAKAASAADCNTGVSRSTIETKVDFFAADVNCELGPACGCGSSATGAFLGFTTSASGGSPTGSVSPPKCVGGPTPGGDCTMDTDCGAACVGGSQAGQACPPATCTGGGTCIAGICRGHLDRGGLYFGGGNVGVPLPAEIPDYGTNFYRVSCCSGPTMILTNTTSTDTGSNRNCTSVGCLYGAPLPIVNAATPAVSTCVINSVSQDASGSGQCVTGDLSTNIPLSSNISLTGDSLPKRCSYTGADDNAGRKCNTDADCPGGGTCVNDPDIQPCPICNPATLKCNGGTNDVAGNPPVSCVPGTVASVGPQFPTSHDCPPGGFPIGALPIPYALTTGSASATAMDLPSQQRVFCGFCFDSNVSLAFKNPAVSCESDADCAPQAPYTTCKQGHSGAFHNALATTITETGTPTGDLTDNASHAGVLVSVFCIPPSFNGLVDPSADLPGPGAVSLPGSAQLMP